jgi:hypothetical protein
VPTLLVRLRLVLALGVAASSAEIEVRGVERDLRVVVLLRLLDHLLHALLLVGALELRLRRGHDLRRQLLTGQSVLHLDAHQLRLPQGIQLLLQATQSQFRGRELIFRNVTL